MRHIFSSFMICLSLCCAHTSVGPCGLERLYAVCLFQRASVVPEPYEGIFHDFFGIPLKSI